MNGPKLIVDNSSQSVSDDASLSQQNFENNYGSSLATFIWQHLERHLKSDRVGGSGGGGNVSDSDRITKLETHFEYVRKDMDELKVGQREISRQLGDLTRALEKLPTRDDLWSWKIQWMAIGVAVIVLVVGGIIGGLDWIKPK